MMFFGTTALIGLLSRLFRIQRCWSIINNFSLLLNLKLCLLRYPKIDVGTYAQKSIFLHFKSSFHFFPFWLRILPFWLTFQRFRFFDWTLTEIDWNTLTFFNKLEFLPRNMIDLALTSPKMTEFGVEDKILRRGWTILF